MSELQLRPRFKFEVDLPEEMVVKKVHAKLDLLAPGQIVSTVIHGHLMLKIHPDKRHFWSPQLDVSLQALENESTLVRCLIAPEASVWTLFMFIYTITGFAAFIGLMLGLSQWTLERNMWGFYLSAISIILGLVFYAIGQFGKKLGTEEMKLLKEVILSIDWKN